MRRNGSLVVHWDGKMLADLIGKTKCDRIAVLVSYNGTSKFLGAPKVNTSSGENIAAVVHNTLSKWNITKEVCAMSFDTTSSNTGINIGACTLLKKHLGCDLLDFACRHHIYELNLKCVFEIKLNASSAPTVSIFERFMKFWPNINQSSFKSGMEDEAVLMQISQAEREQAKKFCNDQLTKSQVRADYKEFLELALIFLGERFKFHTPGATSNARWMSKAIYSLKIYVFRDQFTLTKREACGIRDVCIFLIRLYIRVWFGCTNAIAAPLQDLNFIKDTIAYAKTDSKVSEAVIKKMSNHLWYISEKTVALAFFDSKVSFDEKRRMVQRLKSKEPVVNIRNNRNNINLLEFQKYNISDFVSERTKPFFDYFGLSTSFLKDDPSTWETNFEFEEGWSVCKDLPVVNDAAERGVKFIKDYNKILTNDEEEKEMLLQVVEAYRKKYPSYKKSSLIDLGGSIS